VFSSPDGKLLEVVMICSFDMGCEDVILSGYEVPAITMDEGLHGGGWGQGYHHIYHILGKQQEALPGRYLVTAPQGYCVEEFLRCY
jgi:hypothetical protein